MNAGRLWSIIFFMFLSSIARTGWSQGTKVPKKPTLAWADSVFASGQFATAIPAYEALLKNPSNKTNATAWNRLALSHLNQQQYAQGATAFEEVYRLNRRFPAIFINRAKAYSGAGNINQSLQMIDSAAIIGRFANFTMLENDPAFENLRKDSRYQAVHDRIAANAYPCLSLPEAHQFDFWLGDWDVYQTANLSIKTGFNRITRQAGSCIILENWQSTGPHHGMSLNYFEPISRTWQQKWAGSSQDITEFYDGKFEGDAMKFKWDVRNPNGTTSPGRLTFTNLEPGKVRQHSEQSPDGGKTWQTVYDFTYIRRN